MKSACMYTSLSIVVNPKTHDVQVKNVNPSSYDDKNNFLKESLMLLPLPPHL